MKEATFCPLGTPLQSSLVGWVRHKVIEPIVGKHSIIDCGSGISDEECAAQVAVSNHDLHNSSEIRINLNYPYKELLKLYPETGSLLRPKNGVSIGQIATFSRMTFKSYAIFTTVTTSGFFSQHDPAKTLDKNNLNHRNEILWFIHKNHAYLVQRGGNGKSAAHNCKDCVSCGMRTDEDVQLINGFINSPFYNPEFTARVAGAYGVEIKPPKKELHLKRADVTWHNQTLNLRSWAEPVPTFFKHSSY